MASTLDNMNVRIPRGEESPSEMSVSPQGERIPWGVKDLLQDRSPDKSDIVKVAILDTGVDFRHPDLASVGAGQKDFTGSSSGPADRQGHGTHCAGVVAARSNDSGIIGVDPQCLILSGKVLNDYGSGSERMIANGLLWAAENGADIISMSLGGPSPMREVERIINELYDRGIACIVAAGNEGPGNNTIGYPGRVTKAFTVGAYDIDRRVAGFSSRGGQLDIVGPGVNIESTYLGNRYAVLSGTSMATPHIAGLVSRALGVERNLGGKRTAVEIAELIVASCNPLQSGGQTDFGRGRPEFGLVIDIINKPGPAPTPVKEFKVSLEDFPEPIRDTVKEMGILAVELGVLYLPKVKAETLPQEAPDWFDYIVDYILDFVEDRLKERRPALYQLFVKLRPVIEDYIVELIWTLLVGWFVKMEKR